MRPAHQPIDPEIHALAIRLAQECRRIIQTCLRVEEWRDCDLEFSKVIAEGIESIRRNG